MTFYDPLKPGKRAVGKVTPQFPAVVETPKCPHKNIRARDVGERTIFVCECGSIVDPGNLSGIDRKGTEPPAPSPLPAGIRFVFAKDIDDAHHTFAYAVDITEGMFIKLDGLEEYVPVTNLRPGDRIKIYRRA